MDHAKVIDGLHNALRDAPGVRALFLSGSFATGHADAWSDLDFVMIAENGASDEVAALWRRAIECTGKIVLWWDRMTAPVLINAITEDWTRTDVVILKPDQIGRYSQQSLKTVFDHDGIYDSLPPSHPGPANTPARFRYQVEEFIRILGLLHLADGREEYINGVLGIFHLRNKLVDLMIEETDMHPRGGILHLNRLITEDQKKVLTALPAPEATRAAMIDGHMAYAAAYLPRARKHARDIGADWPEDFEAATWAKLAETLGVTRPY